MPPWECPTIETLAAPVAVSTLLVNDFSWRADCSIGPVARLP